MRCISDLLMGKSDRSTVQRKYPSLRLEVCLMAYGETRALCNCRGIRNRHAKSGLDGAALFRLVCPQTTLHCLLQDWDSTRCWPRIRLKAVHLPEIALVLSVTLSAQKAASILLGIQSGGGLFRATAQDRRLITKVLVPVGRPESSSVLLLRLIGI